MRIVAKALGTPKLLLSSMRIAARTFGRAKLLLSSMRIVVLARREPRPTPVNVFAKFNAFDNKRLRMT
jgi:hypothetical protein